MAENGRTVGSLADTATGVDGPAINTLVKDDDGTFSIPQDTKLTAAQYKSFLAGNLHVTAHSEAHPGCEIRVQSIVGMQARGRPADAGRAAGASAPVTAASDGR